MWTGTQESNCECHSVLLGMDKLFSTERESLHPHLLNPNNCFSLVDGYFHHIHLQARVVDDLKPHQEIICR